MPIREPASREARALELGGDRVEYLLVRRRGRRGVGLKVDAEGLTVSAPLSIPVHRVEHLVRESESWVLKKMAVWRERRVPEVSWAEGALVPWLGAELALRLMPARRVSVVQEGDTLVVHAPSHDAATVSRAVVGWYKRMALPHLAHRAFVFSRLAGLAPPRVMLSSAGSRWGSCNSRREVRLAWRLLKARAELIDYVVCHELAHLRHMNHSREFWSEVERLCPDYRRLRDELEAKDHLYRSF